MHALGTPNFAKRSLQNVANSKIVDRIHSRNARTRHDNTIR